MNTISINRAPVQTLWVAVVAERLGFTEDEALWLGKAVAGLNAQAKGRRLGVGHILGEIAEDELAAGLPMLSAVAVGVSGKPGPGLFALARDLDRLASDSAEAETDFWEKEKTACYQTWKRVLRDSGK